MEREVTAAELQKLIGVNKVALADLAKRAVIVRGDKRGTYTVESVTSYCQASREGPNVLISGSLRPEARSWAHLKGSAVAFSG
jgi:hypothetical protein